MRFLLLSLMALCAAAQTFEPAPAKVLSSTTTSTNDVYVIQETLDGVEFFIGDPRKDVRSVLSRDKYQQVEYGDPKDDAFKLAEAWIKNNDYTKAAVSYRKAIASATYQWVIERSYVNAIDCYTATHLNKPDEGIALAEELLKRFPKTIHIGSVTSSLADLRLAKGDLVGAEQEYRNLEKNAAQWKLPAGRGTLGLANVLKKNKKYPEAIQLLQPAFTSAQNSTSYALLGMGLADVQRAAKQKDEAIKTLRKVALGPSDAVYRAQAHLSLAQCIAEDAHGPTLADAFDYAVLASSLGTNDETEKTARTLCRELATRIDKDSSFSDEERKEYKLYARSLQ